MEKIIIIHPDDDMHFRLNHALGEYYHIESFYRGLNAYFWMQSGNKPDLVITCDCLPDVDLGEVLGSLKNSGYYSDIPVVILSHEEDNTKAQRLLEMGAEIAMDFPLNLNKLKTNIHTLLHQ